MADSTLRGAFELSAEQPIRQLHSIRDAGAEADATLERLGSRMDSLPRRAAVGWGGMSRVVDREAGQISRRIDELDAKLDAFGRKSPRASVSLSGVDRANAQLTELEARLDRLDHRRASAHVGIGGGFGNNAGGGGTAQDARFFSSLGGLGGALPWWAAALPLAPGLLGGAGALLGSAGSATLGAGAVGVGAAGALGVGGLASMLVGKSAIKDLQGLTKAQTAYNVSVKEYGQASTQARTAKLKLDQALATSPPGAAGAARQTSLLSSAFKSSIAPAYSSVYSAIGQGAYSIRQALPELSPLINSATGATARSGAQFTRFLTDPTSIRSYQTLIAGFVSDMPLVESSAQNLTRIFLNLATAAQPFFRDALVWVNGWTGGLARSSGDTAKVSADMQRMVTSAKDWGRFLGAAGRLLRDIFRPGVPAGNSMVTQLTHTLDTWDTWLNRNPAKVQGFFRQGEQSVSNIAGVISNLTKDVWQLFQYLQPIFNRAEQFLKFTTSLGGGNLALGSALAYGGYQGLRSGLGGRGPTAGGLLSTFVLGPGMGRGGGAGAVAGAAGAAEASVAAQAVRAERAAAMHTLLSRGGSVGGALANRAYSTGALDAAAGGYGLLRGGIAGAARFALPVLGISALLAGVSGHGGGSGPLGFGARVLSGLTLNTLSPGQARPLLPAAAGAAPGGALALGGLQLARAGLSGVPGVAGAGFASLGLGLGLGVLGAYGGLMLNPDSAGADPRVLSRGFRAQGSRLSSALGAARTPQGALAVRAQAERALQHLGWSLAAESSNPQADEAKMRRFLERLMKDASDKAGATAAGSWIDALGRGLQRDPKKAVTTALGGMVSELTSLGPAGAKAFSKDMATWAGQMEMDYPKLRAPLDRLMNGISKDLNRMSGNAGTTMSDLLNKVFWFNGQMLTGTQNTWNAISTAMIDPNVRAKEKLAGIWGEIQAQAMQVLTQMGFTRAQAGNIVHTLAGTATPSQFGAAIGATGQNVAGAVRQSGTAQGGLGGGNAGLRAGSNPLHHARGGMLGGSGLLDTLMMPDGSVAAPGEAWIANRHTMKDLDLAARAYYGKPAWEMIRDEPRPHSWPMAGRSTGGGRRAAFGLSGASGSASGSVVLDPGVNMSVGQEPQIYSDLRRLSGELRETVYVISGYRSPAHSVAVGGFSNDPHTRGQAADIGVGSPSRSSMFGVSEAQLRAAGLYRPFYPASAAEVNHVQLLTGGAAGGLGALGAMGASGLPAAQIHLRAPRLGLAGVPGVMADRVSQMITAGATQRINKQLGALGATSGGSTAGLSGSLVNMVTQLAGRYGWQGQVGDWLKVINAESGGSVTATNPGSGAYGIAQFISGPSEYYRYGGNPNTMPGQLLAMANYMRQRYGGPAGAWSHEESSHWYERGGRVAWGGWNAKGFEGITNGPTVFGAGERTREHVKITPIRSSPTPTRGSGITLNFNGPVHFGGSKAELDKAAKYVAGKILDALDGPGDGTDSDLIGAPR